MNSGEMSLSMLMNKLPECLRTMVATELMDQIQNDDLAALALYRKTYRENLLIGQLRCMQEQLPADVFIPSIVSECMGAMWRYWKHTACMQKPVLWPNIRSLALGEFLGI